MAHMPETPEQFVCLNCQVVSAGTVVHDEDADSVRYEEPTRCGACEHSEFVEFGEYSHHHPHGE